jgi:hypothetical protein
VANSKPPPSNRSMVTVVVSWEPVVGVVTFVSTSDVRSSVAFRFVERQRARPL